MHKTSGLLELLGAVLLLTGCAAIGPHGQGDAQGWAKRDPQAMEREAKQILKKMAQDEKLDLCEEAVWVGQKTVMIRASWRRGSEPATGLGATRHMADFVFDAQDPMRLQAVEGENPLVQETRAGWK